MVVFVFMGFEKWGFDFEEWVFYFNYLVGDLWVLENVEIEKDMCEVLGIGEYFVKIYKIMWWFLEGVVVECL